MLLYSDILFDPPVALQPQSVKASPTVPTPKPTTPPSTAHKTASNPAATVPDSVAESMDPSTGSNPSGTDPTRASSTGGTLSRSPTDEPVRTTDPAGQSSQTETADSAGLPTSTNAATPSVASGASQSGEVDAAPASPDNSLSRGTRASDPSGHAVASQSTAPEATLNALSILSQADSADTAGQTSAENQQGQPNAAGPAHNAGGTQPSPKDDQESAVFTFVSSFAGQSSQDADPGDPGRGNPALSTTAISGGDTVATGSIPGAQTLQPSSQGADTIVQGRVTPAVSTAVITIGNTVATENAASEFVFGSQTLQPGSQVTFDGTVVSLATSTPVAIINEQTIRLDAQAITPEQASTVTIPLGSAKPVVVTRSGSVYAIDGTTLQPGIATTIHGIYVSAASSARIVQVGSSTLSLADGASTVFDMPPGTFVVSNTGNEYIVDGVTMTSGHANVVSGLTMSEQGDGSGLVLGNTMIQVGSGTAGAPQATLTFAGSEVTAYGVPQEPDAVVVDGTTLSVGGPALTSDGETISNGRSGLTVADDGRTTKIPLTDVLSASLVPEATLLIDSSTATVFGVPGQIGMIVVMAARSRRAVLRSRLMVWSCPKQQPVSWSEALVIQRSLPQPVTRTPGRAWTQASR